MADLFILGAGFSKAVSEQMPLLAELGTAALARVNAPLPHLDGLPFADDVELLLTYLSQKCPWQSEAEALLERAAFLQLQQAIADVVAEREADVRRADAPSWATRLADWWIQHESRLLTLNYDTCVERLTHDDGKGIEWPHAYGAPVAPAAQRTVAVVGGRRELGLALLKLHGSADWYYAGDPADSGDQVYTTLSWRDFDGARTRDGYRACVRDRVPFIVPPLTEKSAFYGNQTLRAIWRVAAEALENATRIFCLGYSMPLTDLTMRQFFATRPPREKADFYVVNLQSDGGRLLQRYGEALPCEHYAVRDDFLLPDEPIPRFVEWLTEQGSPASA
jgi:hypothetical protein